MKTLYIVRHAKSSWDDVGLADFDRPLNRRGKIDAPRMAKRLRKKEIPLDFMLSSPANRALNTCNLIAEDLRFPQEKIATNQDLYHASEGDILKIIRNLNDHLNCVMIFGHNPGLTDFVNSLMAENIINIPTCGVAACTLDVNHWKDVQWEMGKMIFYDYPKSKVD